MVRCCARAACWSRPGAPEADLAGKVARDEGLAVRGERDGMDLGFMAGQGQPLEGDLGVPEADDLVVAAGGEGLAVGAEGQGPDAARLGGAGAGAPQGALGHIPK